MRPSNIAFGGTTSNPMIEDFLTKVDSISCFPYFDHNNTNDPLLQDGDDDTLTVEILVNHDNMTKLMKSYKSYQQREQEENSVRRKQQPQDETMLYSPSLFSLLDDDDEVESSPPSLPSLGQEVKLITEDGKNDDCLPNARARIPSYVYVDTREHQRCEV